MENKFYNVASSIWGTRLTFCSPCPEREKPSQTSFEMHKTAHNHNFNTSCHISNFSQITSESKMKEKSLLSLPIKFSGNPKGKTWSKEEDETLKAAFKFFNGKNWKLIATKVPERSSTQCSQRWRRIQPYKSRFPWTSEEDQALSDLVTKYGQNWSIIASSLNGRTGKQVRERYINNLDPKINRNRFSRVEDELIIELYTKLGPKWKEISKEFIGRTENMIKNRFYSHIKKKILMKFPMKYKKAIEKAQTESSYKNTSSIDHNLHRAVFSDLDSSFKRKFQDLDIEDLNMLGKPTSSIKLDANLLENEKINNNLTQPMELEDNFDIENNLNYNYSTNDGFLNLFKDANETPKKDFRAIFSPKIEKNHDNNPFHHSNLIKLENIPINFEISDFFCKIEDFQQNDLTNKKNAIFNTFFNSKDFETIEKNMKNNDHMIEKMSNVSNKNYELDEKLGNQMVYLNTKKMRLETMIKEIMGKIDKSNSQNL